MLFKKKKAPLPFDREHEKPVLRCSICTGEQVAGFRDVRTGAFREIMLIRNGRDRERFLETYGLREEELSKEY